MIDERNTLNVTGGMDVFGADGEKVGSVSGVEGDYVVVSKGFFFPTDYYIPVSAINTSDADGLYLSVTKDAALNQGWDAIPATSTTTGTSEGTYNNADRALADQEPVNRAAADTWGTGTPDTGTVADEATDRAIRNGERAAQASDSDTIRVPLTEEELTASTHEVERGKVQVDKVVAEQQQTLDVPVSQEQVNVSRRVVDREVSPDDTTFEEGTIEVPVRGEEVEVGKRARVREELEITKDRVQGTQQVTDTVRHEEANIRDDAGLTVDGDQKLAAPDNRNPKRKRK